MKNKIIIPSILVLIALSFLGVITHAEKPFAPSADSDISLLKQDAPVNSC